MAVTWKKLAYPDDVVLKTDYGSANSVLAANSANAPAAVVMAEQTVLGRITGGTVKALTAAELRTLANVADGAQACNATNVGAAGAVMKSSFTALGDMLIGANASNLTTLAHGVIGQKLTVGAANVVGWADGPSGDLNNVANATVRLALTPRLGEMCFQVDELAPYVCTVIA
jgi:hypothetical protein